MAILKYILALLVATLLTGCYEDFSPEIDTRPVLCLNSLITAGKPIEVEVSHTWVYNDKEAQRDHSVRDATVTVIANGEVVGPDYIPAEGDSIRIMAESLAYGSASADVVVPFATPIGKVKVTPVVTDIRTGDDGLSDYEMDVDISFNLIIEMGVDDPAAVDNYYRFEYNWSSPVAPDGSPTLSVGQFEYDAEPIFKEHIGVFETIMGNDEGTSFALFTDRQFAGKTYTLHLNYTDCVFSVKSRDYDESLLECDVNLYLTTVSPSYYNWAVYKWNVDEGIIGDLSDIGLAEPTWGYSNVSTGAGIVAAQSSTNYTVNLKDFFDNLLLSK